MDSYSFEDDERRIFKIKVLGDYEERESDVRSVVDILEQLHDIEKAVIMDNKCLIERVLRALPRTRKKLNTSVLIKLGCAVFWGRHPNDELQRENIIYDLDSEIGKVVLESELFSWRKRLYVLPEAEIYVYLLMLVFMLDAERWETATEYADEIVDKLSKEDRRSLDLIQAKCYFYYSLTYENVYLLKYNRVLLLKRLQTAFLKNDLVTLMTLINCLLRNYVLHGLYFQADKLVEKMEFPKEAPHSQWARYLYYVGRIKAVKLEYVDACHVLVNALSKAPETAIGFKQTVKKLIIIVELLLGKIPDRAQFNEVKMRRSLTPYFHLTKAVFNGSLTALTATVEQFGDTFVEEKNLTMILRLRYSVIRVGLKRLEITYSRISLDDVARRLQLDSAQEAEYIVAKAICDGLIDGEIDHEKGHLITKPETKLWTAQEMCGGLHIRIRNYLDLYRELVSKMDYPESSGKK